MGIEEKINALYELWDAGTNKDNAERDEFARILDPDMHGRVMNIYQTYDYLDNDKYKRIEQLLEIMQETFGFAKEEPIDEEADTGSNNDVEMVDLPERATGDKNMVAPGDITPLPTRSDLGFTGTRGTTKGRKAKGNY